MMNDELGMMNVQIADNQLIVSVNDALHFSSHPNVFKVDETLKPKTIPNCLDSLEI
jgi:hypothetical protein